LPGITLSPGPAGTEHGRELDHGTYFLARHACMWIHGQPSFAIPLYGRCPRYDPCRPRSVANGVDFKCSRAYASRLFDYRDGVTSRPVGRHLRADTNATPRPRGLRPQRARDPHFARPHLHWSRPRSNAEAQSHLADRLRAGGGSIFLGDVTIKIARHISGTLPLGPTPLNRVLINLSTSRIAAAPPSLSSATLTSSSYYSCVSRETALSVSTCVNAPTPRL